ncbi:MAG: hypothetical protein WAW82_00480 [Candidatus Lutibacillus vidarii]
MCAHQPTHALHDCRASNRFGLMVEFVEQQKKLTVELGLGVNAWHTL